MIDAIVSFSAVKLVQRRLQVVASRRVGKCVCAVISENWTRASKTRRSWEATSSRQRGRPPSLSRDAVDGHRMSASDKRLRRRPSVRRCSRPDNRTSDGRIVIGLRTRPDRRVEWTPKKCDRRLRPWTFPGDRRTSGGACVRV